MSSPIPLLQTGDLSHDTEPRVISLEGPDTEDLFETLSSTTRREILQRIYETPSTPTELADATDTSLQNVHYHLEKLESADLVESIGTRYSEKAQEMQVYGPTNDPLILVDSEETRSSVRDSLDSILGAISTIVIASVLVQWLSSTLQSAPTPGTYTMSAQESAVSTPTVTTAADQGIDVIAQLQSAVLEPGALVFLGGCIAVVALLLFRRYVGRGYSN